MHQRRRSVQRQSIRRVIAGGMLAFVMASGVAAIVAVLDPTEALCKVYTDSDPEWYIFACWRF